MSGLFSTFNIVKRGMEAQQSALHVVSHNVANSNTKGYSVQRANLKTSQPFGMPSLNSAGSVGQLGTGVMVDSITRSRDIFLDGQIRKETSILKKYESREEFLSNIETVFMEPSDEAGLAAMMNRFWDSWNALSNKAESSAARTLVAQNADEMSSSLRHMYDSLNNIERNNADLIHQQTFDVSTVLTQITDLNEQIKNVTIAKQTPNDLMDQRDALLEQLSEKFSIEVDQTDFNGVSIKAKVTNENGTTDYVNILTDTTINNGLAFVNSAKLTIGGNTYNSQNLPLYIPATTTNVSVQLNLKVDGMLNSDATSQNMAITDLNDLKKYYDVEEVIESGSVVGYKLNGINPHVMLYDKTSYDPVNKTIGTITPGNFESGSLMGYDSVSQATNTLKDQLNSWARLMSTAVNAIHSGNLTNTAGAPSYAINFFVSSQNETAELAAGSISELETSIDTSSTQVQQVVEAARWIKVNKTIVANVDNINAGKIQDKTLNTYSPGNGERALLIGSLRNIRLDYAKITDRASLIGANGLVNTVTDPVTQNLSITSDNEGATFNNYYNNTVTQLGILNKEASKMVVNQESLLSQLDTRRESISGVSLDEEMTNMLQFQKSYQANAKMISVIDQLLDVVVNGLIR